MPTEILDIVVRQKGARVVARDIAKIAVSAQSATVHLKAMQRAAVGGAVALKGVGASAKTAAAGLGAAAVGATAATAALRQMGIGAALVGGAIVRGIGGPLLDAVKIAGEFQSAINFTAVLAQVDRGSEAFERLALTAKELGRTTQFTATQAAGGLQFLAKAGLSANEAIGAIPQTLKIAAIGNINLAKASDITTNILRGFQLRIDELAPAVDVLAKTVTSSNVDILQLAESFKKVGPVAASFNQSFADTAAVIGRLGDAGIQTEESGTALRRIFINLQKDVGKADSILNNAGVSIRDLSGEFRPLIEIFEDIGKAALSPAQKIELFAARALAASEVLSAQGEQSLRDFAAALDDSVGRASEVAEARLFGFRGAVIKLKSAFEALQIAFAEAGLQTFLTSVVEGLTSFVRVLALTPKPILAIASALLSFVAAGGAVLLFMGLLKIALLSSGFATFSGALGAAQVGLQRFFLFMLTNPIGILITALGLATIAAIKFKDTLVTVGGEQVTFAGIVDTAWNRISDKITSEVDKIADSLGLVTAKLAEVADQSITDRLASGFVSAVGTILGVFNSISRIIEEFNTAAKIEFIQFAAGVIRVFGSIPGAVRMALAGGDLSQIGTDLLNTFQEGAIDSFAGFGARMSRVIQEEMQGAQATVSDFLADAAEASAPRLPEGAQGRVSGLEGTDAGPGEVAIGGEEQGRRQTALDALESSLSPATEATLEFAEAVITLNQAQEAGIITGRENTKILNALAEDGYEAVLATIDPVVALEREEIRTLQALEAAARNASISQEELALAQQKVAVKTEEAKLNLKEHTDQLSLTDSFTKGVSSGFKDFSDSLGSSFDIIRNGMANAFRAGLDALNEFIATGEFNFRAFAEGILGLIQEIITQLIVVQAVKFLTGGGGAPTGKRHGGDISPAQSGTPFIVGEEGPELFVPSTAGKVIPSDQVGGGGAAPVVNVQVVNVDDPKSVTDALSTKEGERVIMNIISRNTKSLRELGI